MRADFRRVGLDSVDWEYLDSFADRNIHQTLPWLQFIAKARGADPLIAELRDSSGVLGYFTGVILKIFGITILASPFPGLSTTYMGFNLRPGVSRASALEALSRFAFSDLGCSHLELMDRQLSVDDARLHNFDVHLFRGYEIDLRQSEESMFSNMKRQCRGCIRKAARSGVVVEQADVSGFANEFYEQLWHVFTRQCLVPPYGVDRVRALLEYLYPTGQLLLLRAKNRNGVSVATGIFPAMNGTAFAWGLASWRHLSRTRPVEALIWHALKYWKNHGMETFDFVGGGRYKKKYGSYEIAVPWIRKSSNPFIAACRSMARPLFDTHQRVIGSVYQTGALVRNAFSRKG